MSDKGSVRPTSFRQTGYMLGERGGLKSAFFQTVLAGVPRRVELARIAPLKTGPVPVA